MTKTQKWHGSWRYALTGVLAALTALGVGHLVAAVTLPSASPVLAIGSTVIDATPTPVKEWAVAHFGTNDKLILLSSIAIVTLLAAAGIGLLSRHRPRVALTLIAVLGLAATVAAAARPEAALLSVVPGVVATISAAAVFEFLRRRASSGLPPNRAETATGKTAASRRAFLLGAGAVAASGAAAAFIGQHLITMATSVSNLVLPRAKEPLPPFPAGIENKVAGLSPLRTPNTDYYRVDTALALPRIDPATWHLTIDGDVEKRIELTLADLMAMDVIERDITMTCVSNDIGGPYVGSARWLGVRTRDVLAMARPRSGTEQILSTDVDGMTISTPLQALTDDREALLAFGMNGKPLPAEHGFPLRLVTPRLYGFVGSTKWVTRLTATTYAAQQAYWTRRGWAINAPVLTQARIDVPRALSSVPSGKPTFIAGVAWAQGRGVSKVEVSIDDGPWMATELGVDAGVDLWRQWYLPWSPQPGQHTIQVRGTDRVQGTQTEVRSSPFPSGATGWQRLVVTVT